MSVLVTGASGFVGSYLVAELVGRGASVVATSRRRPGYLDRPEFAGVRFVAADVRDAAALGPALEGATRVYHAAALFDFYASAKELLAVNAEGTATLVRLMIERGVPELVNVSSGSVYGSGYANELATESFEPRPTDKYARSKWEQELAIARLAGDRVRVVSLRPGAICGPGSRYGDATALYLLKRGLLFGVPGLGKVISSHVHVRDVCRAAVHLGDAHLGPADDPARTAYNVSDDTPTFNEELLRRVAAMLPAKGLLGFWGRVRIPAFALKLSAFGAEGLAAVTGTRPLFEVASIDYVTCGHGLANGKIKATGFAFRYPSMLDAIGEIVRWYEDTNWRIFEEPELLYACVKPE